MQREREIGRERAGGERTREQRERQGEMGRGTAEREREMIGRGEIQIAGRGEREIAAHSLTVSIHVLKFML